MDPQATAAAIVDAVRSEEAFDLILLGNEAADAGNYQVGIRVATPRPAGRHRVEEDRGAGDRVRCERDVGGARDVYEVPLPAVLTALEGLNLPRYPSVPGRLRRSRSRSRSPSRAPRLEAREAPARRARRAGRAGRDPRHRRRPRRRESSRSCCSSVSRERRPELRVSMPTASARSSSLREHAAVGRLTLEEFTERIDRCVRAVTREQLDELARDLPKAPAAAGSRRRPTRWVISVFGSTKRDGRIRARRRVVCLTIFGNVDLDLRQATLEGDAITILAVGMFGAVDVYVPEAVEVDAHGLAIFGHKGAHGNDLIPQPGTPLVQVFALSVFAGIDVWRVPAGWASRKLGEVIRGIRRASTRSSRREQRLANDCNLTEVRLLIRNQVSTWLQSSSARLEQVLLFVEPDDDALAAGALVRAQLGDVKAVAGRRRTRPQPGRRRSPPQPRAPTRSSPAGSDRGNELLAHVAARLDQPFAANVTGDRRRRRHARPLGREPARGGAAARHADDSDRRAAHAAGGERPDGRAARGAGRRRRRRARARDGRRVERRRLARATRRSSSAAAAASARRRPSRSSRSSPACSAAPSAARAS